jgi:hypothetical protein
MLNGLLLFLALSLYPQLSQPGATPLVIAVAPIPALPCGSAPHCVTLTWTAPPEAATCLATSTPPCALGYNVLRGTTPGGESATPLNGAPITTTSYTDVTVTLGASPITYYYVVQAVEAVGTVIVTSPSSSEASASFPGIPLPPPSPPVLTPY